MSTNLNKGLTLFSVCAATMLLTACQGVDKPSGPTQTVSKQLSQGQQFMLEPNTLDLKSSKVKTVSSRYDFEQTVARLKSAISSKNMTLFAEIDHTQAAQDAGLQMQPATVLIFGHPKAGTPLMKKDPTFALQLPLKVLITEVDNKVLVSFNDTRELIRGSNIEYSDVENSLAAAEKLISNTVTQ